MNAQYRLLIKAENPPGAVSQMSVDEEQRLDVRDLTTRLTTKVSALEVSPYRHVLFLDGKEFRILNVIRSH